MKQFIFDINDLPNGLSLKKAHSYWKFLCKKLENNNDENATAKQIFQRTMKLMR